MKSVYNITISTVVFYFFLQDVFCQSLVIKDDTVILGMDKVTGFGPDGNHSFGIQKRNQFPDSVAVAFPRLKNTPENLVDLTEYFFIVNKFQFFYQNYRNGIYNKNLFLNTAKQNDWNLSDTVFLSAKPLKCGFSTLVGFDTSKIPMYIIDANNNGDLSDDVLRPLLKGVHNADDMVEASVPTSIESLTNSNIEEEPILVFVQGGDPKDIAFSFPEFRFSKFNFNGKPYLICTDIYQYAQANVTVIPDRPYFSSVGRDKKVSIGQFIKLDGLTFELVGYFENGRKILLKGRHADLFATSKKLSPNKISSVIGDSLNKSSSQVGFKAPIIKGINSLTGSSVNTSQLRGKYLFVDFWSTTCAPCIAEFKYLREAYSKYNRNQFEIIGVVDERSKNRVQELAAMHSVNWPNIKMNIAGTDITGYKISSYPTTYLIDPEGNIISTNLRGNELLSKLRVLIK